MAPTRTNSQQIGDATIATADLADDAVTYAKMQNVSATDKLLGRSTAGAGNPEEIPCTAAGRALLAVSSANANTALRGPTSGVAAAATYRTETAADIVPAGYGPGNVVNATLTTSISSNALTIALKTYAGTDPAAADPVRLLFRGQSDDVDSGVHVERLVTGALSFTISSGSTCGFTANLGSRLWVVVFDDGGTIRLGAINCLNGSDVYRLKTDILASSTAEGGAGAADSTQIIYTGTAVTSKPMLILGYLEWPTGLATPGTWAAMSIDALFNSGVPLPGEVVQSKKNSTLAVATGTTTIPFDDTIPQNGEGDQYLSQAITPKSAANVLKVNVQMATSSSVTAGIIVSLFRDSTASSFNALWQTCTAAFGLAFNFDYSILANSTMATTIKARAGLTSAGTLTLNGQTSARKLGGVMGSFLEVQEIMA